MAFNGSGSFSLTGSSSSDYETGDTAVGTDVYGKFSDIATGLGNVICRDGQSTISADIPFGSNRITGLGDATADTDALNRQTADARYAELSGFTMAGTALGAGYEASGFITGDLTEITASTLTTSAAHLGKWVNITHGSGCTVTLHSSPGEGAEIGFIQRGAGQITFAVASGTLRTRESKNKSAGQYAGVVAVYRDGEWHLFGDRTS